MEQAQDKNKLERLVAEYEKKLRQVGTSFYMDALDLLDIADFYTKEGRLWDAETCLRHAMKLHPDDEEVLLSKAYALKDEGKLQEAEKLVASLKDQEVRGVRMFWAELRLNAMEPEKAEEIIRDYWESLAVADYDVCTEAAELYLDYGYLDRALGWLEKIPSLDKHCKELAAECYYQKENYGKAIRLLNEILDKDPYDDITWSQLAEVQYKSGLNREALDSCDYALAIRPDSEQALRLKSSACMALGDYEAASRYGQEYARRCPADYSFALTLGEAMYAQDNLEAALDFLKRAHANCPQEAQERLRILSGITYVYVRQGLYAKAYETLSCACSMGSSASEVSLQVANLCLDNGGTDFALRLLQDLLSAGQLKPEQKTRIAAMLCDYSCFKEARKLWKQLMPSAVVLDRSIAPYLALACRELGDTLSFRLFLSVACKSDPTTTQRLFMHIYPGLLASDYEAAAAKEG